MSYLVNYTETTNPAKPAITVADLSLNTQTSLTFPGKNYAGYAPVIAENFLHLLENFAKNTAPSNPVEGQLWYDNSAGVELLKVYDGTTWNPTGSVKKAATAPTNNSVGDLWVNTDLKQLNVWGGSSWLLVGPEYSTGSLTGTKSEQIVDVNNVTRNVVSFYVGNTRIAIVSKSSFTPKAQVTGFSVINRGFNLTSINIDDTDNSAANTKMWGTASQAEALLVGSSTVSAENFLRSDVSSTSNFPINIRNSGGLSIGTDLSFNIGQGASSTILYSKTSGKSIEIKLTNAGSPFTSIYLDATGKIGMGANNTSPSEVLDVIGNIKTTGIITTTSTQESTGLGIGSIATSGGLSVTKKSNFGGDATFASPIYLSNLTGIIPNDNVAVILPSSDSASEKYNIGSPTRKFKNIYATNFIGSFNGAFTGSLAGNISGSAASLANSTTFQIAGDVTTTAGLSFNGITQNGTATFNTVVSTSVISGKTETTTSESGDKLLIYRSSGGGNLFQTSKQTFLSNVATVPVGTILPWAGPVSQIPLGYLLCDGGEVAISDFTKLWQLIGYTYRAQSDLKGYQTFALPDLRGRFPLGIDSMDNQREVYDKTAPIGGNGLPTVTINAGGKRNGVNPASDPANRVTDVTADVLGGSSGVQSAQLALANLPDHKHDLKSGSDQFYAAGIAVSGNPNAVPNAGISAGNGSQGINNSGSVIGGSATPTPLTVMNPYLAINYIIFTGEL